MSVATARITTYSVSLTLAGLCIVFISPDPSSRAAWKAVIVIAALSAVISGIAVWIDGRRAVRREAKSLEVDAAGAQSRQVQEAQESQQEIHKRIEELHIIHEELERRIAALKNVSVPTVDYFFAKLADGESRNARRDYFLFAAGVAASTLLTIVLRRLGLA